jgi:hypothetical protein
MIVFSQSGPFGLRMGMTFDQVKEVTGKQPELIQDYKYIVTPPKEHNMFETYLVQISPTYGVVFIKAVSKDITASSYGTELMSDFDDIVSSIARTYGEYDMTNLLLPGSIWDEPRDFMMSLQKKERFIIANWDREYDSTLPDDIKSIYVSANALTGSKGYIALEYYSHNQEKAEAEIKSEQDDVF